MKFILPEDAPTEPELPPLRVGNVYRVKNKRCAQYWVVIAIWNDMVHMVGVNEAGAITGVQTYGRWCMEGSPGGGPFKPREVIGFCEGLDDLCFSLQLYPTREG